MIQIHKKIELARIAAGLTQEELADKIGVKRSTYQYWEEVPPKLANIEKVAKALNIPMDYFFVKNDEKPLVFDEPEAVYKKEEKSLNGLIESNRALAEANKILAEAHRVIGENNKDLIKLLVNLHKDLKDPSSLVDPGKFDPDSSPDFPSANEDKKKKTDKS